MPLDKKEVRTSRLEEDLVDAIGWVAGLDDNQIAEQIREYIPTEDRVLKIPPDGEDPSIYTGTGMAAALRKSTEAMKPVTDILALRKTDHSRNLDGGGPLSFSIMAFAFSPYAFIELVDDGDGGGDVNA